MLKDRILECINGMETGDLIALHNNFCDAVNACDCYIYSMDDLDELCAGQSAEWIAGRIFYGEFNPNDDYITFNGYGNFMSFNGYNAKRHVFAHGIAGYIMQNNDSLYNDDIQDILNEHETGAY